MARKLGGGTNLRLQVKRLNDLAIAEHKRVDEKFALISEYEAKLNVAEAKRIDAIRAVDVNAVSVANEKATAQAIVLANQVTQSAETLRALVAQTANTTAQQLQQLTTQLQDRLTSLEKSQYEGKGSTGGMKDFAGWIFAAITVLLGIGGLVFAVLSK